MKFQEYQHTNWAVGWEAGFGGPWRFAAQYIQGGEGTCKLTAGQRARRTGCESPDVGRRPLPL